MSMTRPSSGSDAEADGRPASHGPHPAHAYWELDTSRATSFIHDLSMDEVRREWDWAERLLALVDIADVNQQTVHLVGFFPEREGMVGRPMTEFWPADSVTALAEMILTCSGDPGAERTFKGAISSLTLEDAILTVWRHEAGHPNRLCLAVEGTTIDTRSLRDLRSSEERYRRLLQHLPFALLQVDATHIGRLFASMKAAGVSDLEAHLDEHPELIELANRCVRVTNANRSAVKLFGADDVEGLFGPVGYVFAACPAAAARVMKAHFNGVRNYSETMKVRTLDKRLIDVQLTVTYPAPPEQLDVTLLSLEDITDRLQTDAELRELQTDFTRAARILTLGELATSIAHEVSQPLAAILTNAETSLRWLSRGDGNLAKVKQLNSRIATSARHASDVVQRIRSMAAKHSAERSTVEINEIVQEVLLFISHDLEVRSVSIKTTLGRDLPPILGDRVQLQQVIVNLILNSAQAMAQAGMSSGHITLRTTSVDQTGLSFVILDDGPGIADEHIDHIFEGFFTTKEDGIGVGLAICQSIIASHGGSITASNRPEGGACFRLWLPAGGGVGGN